MTTKLLGIAIDACIAAGLALDDAVQRELSRPEPKTYFERKHRGQALARGQHELLLAMTAESRLSGGSFLVGGSEFRAVTATAA